MIPNVTFAGGSIENCQPLANTQDELEFLGMAAKAIGFELYVNACGVTHIHKDGQGRPWSPLASNADALELQIALRIGIEFEGSYAYVEQFTTELPEDAAGAEEQVRMLIVLAAAQVGRSMP